MSAALEQGVETTAGGGVLNVEALLAPIAGENPSGVSLRYEATYDDIRTARRADDQLEQGAWKRERKLSDWSRVVELTCEALATRTKDLQIGAWLAEALVRLHGFDGLRDGLKVMRGLQLNFWDTLYPEIDEGYLDARANSLAWLDTQLSLAVRDVPLTEGAGGVSYTFRDWEESQKFDIPENLNDLESAELERINQIRMKAADERKINSEQWRSARDTTGRPFYEAIFAALNDCWAEFKALDAVTDEKFGAQSPGLHALSRTLEDLRAVVGKIVVNKRELEPDAVASWAEEIPESHASDGRQATGAASFAPSRPSSAGAGGRASSREEAFRKLAEAAAYFREAEPHSPVSYLVERAIRWGQMPLEDWLAEVVKSDDVLLSLREMLGMNMTRGAYGAETGADEGDG